MNKTILNADDNYFAAANSYNGFYSEFDKTFSTHNHERIFILKGGPGTGKSSLIKNIIAWGKENGHKCSAIYCSSDPKSLDGAIISKESRSIAILDGTAPHDIDARLPGAAEEICDLGAHLNNTALRSNKELLESLLNSKQAAYERAYLYLQLAGNINNIIFNRISELIDYSEAERLANKIIPEGINNSEHPCRTKMITRFSRDGKGFIDGYNQLGLKEIVIKGDGISEYVVMDHIVKKLSAKNSIQSLCISVPDLKKYDAAITNKILFRVAINSEDGIPCESIYKKKSIEINRLLQMRTDSENLAKCALKEASDHHFELEKYYSSAMNFTLNERLTKRIISDCSFLLNT